MKKKEHQSKVKRNYNGGKTRKKVEQIGRMQKKKTNRNNKSNMQTSSWKKKARTKEKKKKRDKKSLERFKGYEVVEKLFDYFNIFNDCSPQNRQH